VGVDLHQKISTDDHRLELGLVDVRRNDGAASRHLVAHELGGDLPWYRRSPRGARMLKGEVCRGTLRLSDGHELHLRRHDAATRRSLRDLAQGYLQKWVAHTQSVDLSRPRQGAAGDRGKPPFVDFAAFGIPAHLFLA